MTKGEIWRKERNIDFPIPSAYSTDFIAYDFNLLQGVDYQGHKKWMRVRPGMVFKYNADGRREVEFSNSLCLN